MYNYPHYWKNMQQCNLITSQFYSFQSQNVNCVHRVNEACTNVAFNLQQQRIEDIRKSYKDFPKSCFNCKHRHGTWCNKFQRHSAIASAPTALMGTGDCLGYRYWEPIKSVDDSLKDCCCETQNQQKPKNDSTKNCGTCKNRDIRSVTLCGKLRTFNLAGECVFGGYPHWEPKIDIGTKYSDTKTSISTELSQCKTNEENLEVARKHGLAIDLTKQENQPEKDLQTKIRIEELKRKIEQLEAKQLQTNFFKPFQQSDVEVASIDEVGAIVRAKEEDIGRVGDWITNVYQKGFCSQDQPKPEKKYTVYDLYELVFPDDPIKAHFDVERKRIIEKYKKQEEVVEKISVPDMPKRHPEPIPTETYDDSSDLFEVMGAVMGGILVGVLLVCIIV